MVMSAEKVQTSSSNLNNPNMSMTNHNYNYGNINRSEEQIDRRNAGFGSFGNQNNPVNGSMSGTLQPGANRSGLPPLKQSNKDIANHGVTQFD